MVIILASMVNHSRHLCSGGPGEELEVNGKELPPQGQQPAEDEWLAGSQSQSLITGKFEAAVLALCPDGG